MSTPVFIDIHVQEQTKELRSYLKHLGSDIAEENSEGGLPTDLKKIIGAADLCWDKLNSDADIEMLFHGILSLILMVPQAEAESVVTFFSDRVGKAGNPDKRVTIRIKILGSLFHGLEETSGLRYSVYVTMLKLAGKADLLHMVPTNINQVKKWITQWDINVIKIQSLLRALHDALVEGKQGEQATKVMIELLATYTEDNASQARDDAHRCIVTCLGDPSTFLMDHLLTLKPVKFLEGELIHDLLTIFVSGKLVQYQQFYKNNTDFVNSLGLNHEQNLKKMRVLTFMQLVEGRKEIDFKALEEELDLGEDDVEEFIIDVIKTKTVAAKIDQMQRRVLISWTTHRTFARQQWQELRQYLSTWHEQLGQLQTHFKSLDQIASQPPA